MVASQPARRATQSTGRQSGLAPSIRRTPSQWEGVTLEGSQATVSGSGHTVPVSGRARGSRGGARGGGGGARGRAERAATSTPRDTPLIRGSGSRSTTTPTAGITKTVRSRPTHDTRTTRGTVTRLASRLLALSQVASSQSIQSENKPTA